jgi:class 3 adenylate cyclase
MEDMPVPEPRPTRRGADMRTILRDHYLFGKLTPQNIDRLTACIVTKTVKGGTNIFAKGDPGTSLFAIGSGTVRISAPYGKDAVFNVLGEGSIFGELALLDGNPRSVDVTAVTDCELFVIERRDFLPLIREEPEIALKLIETLCSKLRRSSEQIEAQASDLASWNQTLEQRVAEQVAEIERIGRLKRFLPRQIAKLVVSSGHERVLESHRRQVTVLFCDLRGFTAFSEISEPEEVILVLREYHTALGVLVDKFEGTVERFTGDGLLVIFNDPLPCPDPSIRAVQMAVEMRDEVTKLSVKWSRSGHDIGFGIGIAHGYATLGTVGYEGQFQYSVTGKVANLASRLCNEAKNGQILIDINVFSAVETQADAEFTEELILKGFSRPVKAFNVRNLRS